MKRRLFKALSFLLTLIILLNLLPLQILAQELQTASQTAAPEEEYLAQPSLPEATQTADILGEATILEEIVEARTEFSKSYRLSNGLNMAIVYPEAVHYEDGGQWQEIDSTLQAVGSGETGTYITTAGPWQAEFPQRLRRGAPVRVSKDGYSVGFELSGELRSAGVAVYGRSLGLTHSEARKADAQVHQFDYTEEKEKAQYPRAIRENLRSRISYTDVYENTDIIFDISSGQLKESVVLNTYDAEVTGYTYTLHTGSLVPVLNGDGSIDLQTADGAQTVFSMPAPYLVDDAGATSYDIAVSLVQNGDSYTLTYQLPTGWLADESRRWPVILDPAIVAHSGASGISDQCVMETGAVGYTNAGLLCGYLSYHGAMHTYIRFTSLPTLSSADIIVNAELSLYIFETSGAATIIEAHEVLESWDSQTITWATQPDVNSLTEDFCAVGTSGRFYWNITDLAQSWYTNGNYGVMLKATDAVENAKVSDFKRFYSSDCGMYGSEWWPYLTVTYRNANGLESYWDYSTASAGRAGTGYVNNYTGNLTWVRGDLGFGGNRMPVSVSHIYNSGDSASNAFGLGYGWKTNYNQKVTLSDGGYYAWLDGDGTTHCFIADADGTLVDEDGLELTLTVSSAGYTITDKYGNTSKFNTDGYLTHLTNNQATPSEVSVEYADASAGLISQITDGAGRVYKFTYTNGLLTRISYYGTGTKELTYVSFGYTDSKLTSVTDKDGEVCTYAYSDTLLQQATDVDGYHILYTYGTGSPKRVVGIQEKDGTAAGSSLTIEYAHN